MFTCFYIFIYIFQLNLMSSRSRYTNCFQLFMTLNFSVMIWRRYWKKKVQLYQYYMNFTLFGIVCVYICVHACMPALKWGASISELQIYHCFIFVFDRYLGFQCVEQSVPLLQRRARKTYCIALSHYRT